MGAVIQHRFGVESTVITEVLGDVVAMSSNLAVLYYTKKLKAV